MGNIEITKTQRLYLLFLLNNEGKNKISDLAEYFQCSRPNSKNILDNMLKEGFLYKDGNSYLITKIGYNIANKFECNRQDIEYFLDVGLGLEQDLSFNCSYNLLCSEMDCLGKRMINKSNIIKSFNKEFYIKPENICNILEKNKYKGYLTIKNTQIERDNSSLKKSMAMKGFDENIEICIDDEPYINIKFDSIIKNMDSHMRKGMVFKINYKLNNEIKSVLYKEGQFKIPLEAFVYWTLIGNRILQSYIKFEMESTIGQGTKHKKEALFIITLDLAII